ncbi:MAG TPA: hypothetical protein VNS58_28285 [Puia sp.]|nr:hypothetical protein [Puia sp.]
METFQHIKTVLSIILGLSITHLLKGTVKLIQHPGREKPYLVHLLWSLYLFLVLVHFWWWEYQLKVITTWVFGEYFFVIGYIITYYVLCALLFPDDLKDFDGYEDYFYKKKTWFFSVLAISFLADTLDTLIKGKEYFLISSVEYPIRITLHVGLCLLAIWINNKRFHLILVILFLLYELSFIWRMYAFER